MSFFLVFYQLLRANVDAKILTRRADRFEDHFLDVSLLEFQFVVFRRDVFVYFLKISDQVYLGLLGRLVDALAVDGPPAADQALVLLVDSDLRYLTHLARGVALQKSQDLLILPTLLLFVIMVSDFDDIKRKILIINFLLDFLVFFV